MRNSLRVVVAAVVTMASAAAPIAAQPAPVRIALVGDTNLRPEFLDSLSEAAKDSGLSFEVVSRPAAQFVLAIAQESGRGGSNAAVIVLDRAGEVAASVVRGGRFSAKGAVSACAQEIAKKMAVLQRTASTRPPPSTSETPGVSTGTGSGGATPAPAPGTYTPGSGVTLPRLLKEVKPGGELQRLARAVAGGPPQ